MMKLEKFNLCLERIRKGDMQGLADIYYEYYQKMTYTALTRVNDLEEARDIASDFIKHILENANDIKVTENPDAWILRAVRNKAIDHIKKHSRQINVSDFSDILPVEHDYEFHHMFLKAFNELKPHEKEVALLSFYGYKYREIALMLDRPEGTIKSDMSEIRRKLQHLKKIK